MIYTLNERRAKEGFPALLEIEVRKKRIDAFKAEVRKLARAQYLSVDFVEGNLGPTMNVQFKDERGKFGVILNLSLITNGTADALRVIYRNITRKDRGQW